MGGATAFHLARRGLRVLGLDRFRLPHTLGSSYGRTRVIREAYFEHPSYVPLVQSATNLWRELEERSGRELLRVTGAAMLGSADSAAVRGSLASARQHGIPHECWSAEEVQRHFPALRPEPDMVAVWEPGAGALAVEDCVTAHLEAAQQSGAELRFDEAVLEWRASADGVEVVTEHGRFAAGALVLAAGAWMPTLVPWLPLTVTRQVQLWFRPAATAALLQPGRFPIFLWELPTGELFYGLPDFGDGVKAARHHGGEVSSALATRREVDDNDVSEVRRFLDRYIPAANGPMVEASVCLYTNTPSGHFLLDRHPEHPTVWLMSPCSGHGFKFAPAIGESIARGVVSNERPRELEFFGLQPMGPNPAAG
jgi:sarcosine oxidase